MPDINHDVIKKVALAIAITIGLAVVAYEAYDFYNTVLADRPAAHSNDATTTNIDEGQNQ